MATSSSPPASVPELPSRKQMNHRGPLTIDVSSSVYFITIAAAERNGSPLLPHAADILSAARYYHEHGHWFLSIFLVMPDHLHMLVTVGHGRSLADVIGHWKSYMTTRHHIRFQHDFFDTRIRDDAHYAEKWNYICRNPVAKGLVATPREWPHVIAFDRETGVERPHR